MQRDAVLDVAFDALVTMDASGRVLSMNAAAERMFRVDRFAAAGQALSSLIAPVDARAEFERALDRAGVPQRFELQLLGADGQSRPVDLSLSRHDVSGEPVVAAWIRDLSDRRAADEKLRQSEAQLRQALKMEAVGRLAGGVAHDFNNVLTAIFGYADLLLDGLEAQDPRRADVEEIKRAANRAATLTRQLLAFSRKQVLQPRRVNLNDVIASIGTLLATLVGDEIELITDTDPALGGVRADPGQIEQVLMNLAANARDAMPEGGRLTIATANVDLSTPEAAALTGLTPGSFVTLTVSDTGHGVPEHARPHVFEPFFTTKEQGKGTGLGLATVYGIVKQSGGWIYLNDAPGEGASFRIYLPRVE